MKDLRNSVEIRKDLVPIYKNNRKKVQDAIFEVLVERLIKEYEAFVENIEEDFNTKDKIEIYKSIVTRVKRFWEYAGEDELADELQKVLLVCQRRTKKRGLQLQ